MKSNTTVYQARNNMDYLEFLEKELRKTANTALGYFGKVNPITKPGDNNQVLTEADLAVGKQLVEAVKVTYPDHNIIDEEAGAINNGSKFTWVIDPIEATSNFAAGMPDYGIMIGLLEDTTPIAGGLIVPAYDRLYLGQKGKGSTLNGKSIQVSNQTDLTKMLISFGIDSHVENPELTYKESRLMGEILLASRNIRNSGCEAVDPMYVAQGMLGGRVNLSAKIWDNVGPQIIAEEAGALWTGLDGSKLDYSNPTERIEQNYPFVVAPPALHEKLIRITRPYV